jgi:hypothetical protein
MGKKETLNRGPSNTGGATETDCEQTRDSLIVLSLSHPPFLPLSSRILIFESIYEIFKQMLIDRCTR